MKKILALMLFISSLTTVLAQKPIKELTIGDKCPDVVLNKVLNHPTGTMKLSELRGKWVILDFMATNCSGCIEALPRLDAYQQKFGDKLRIIPICPNETALVQKMLERKYLKGLKLPVVAEDSILSAHFRHEYIPHEVWLDPNGVVRAITASEYITEKNIEYALSGQEISWRVKKDVGDYTFDRPLLIVNKEQENPKPMYYSVLTGHLSGVLPASKLSEDSSSGIRKWTIINSSIITLYRQALNKSGIRSFPLNRIFLEVKNPARYIYDKEKGYRNQWYEDNTYCYEAIVPINTSEEERRLMLLRDLNRSLGLNGRLEKRRIPCLVITKIKKAPASDLKIKRKEVEEVNRQNFVIYETTGDLARDLGTIQQELPVTDESGIKEKLNISIPQSIRGNPEEISKILDAYGLTIIKGTRELEVFIISEK